MSENILSPDPTPSPSGSDLEGSAQPADSMAGRSDPTVVPNVVPVPKKSPVLLFIALTLLAAVSVFAIYLFLQVRTLTLEKITPSPTPTPAPSADPTVGWETYINDDLGLSFKVPQNYLVVEKVPGYLTVSTTEDIDKAQAGISIETRLKKPYDNYSDATTYFYDTFDQRDVKSLNDQTDNSVGHQVSWVTFSGTGKIGQLKGVNFKIAFKQYKTGVIVVETLANSNSNYSQIFSEFITTFKYTDDLYQDFSFTCPPDGWQDCMPILSEEGQKACSEEAMQWYQSNCPDFQGAAL